MFLRIWAILVSAGSRRVGPTYAYLHYVFKNLGNIGLCGKQKGRSITTTTNTTLTTTPCLGLHPTLPLQEPNNADPSDAWQRLYYSAHPEFTYSEEKKKKKSAKAAAEAPVPAAPAAMDAVGREIAADEAFSPMEEAGPDSPEIPVDELFSPMEEAGPDSPTSDPNESDPGVVSSDSSTNDDTDAESDSS